jgi:V8-like Glu-specific endopeptidase
VVTVGIQNKKQPGLFAWQATGFLVGQPIREIKEEDAVPKTLSLIYLVTNKHVFEHFEETGHESFAAGFNPQPAAKSEVAVYVSSLLKDGERQWTGHHTEDVAVIPVNAPLLKQQGRQFESFRLKANIWSVAKMKSEGVSEGDFVYILGYPMGIVDQDWHYPIVRSGSIARIRDVLDGRRSLFLLDIQNFPGSSGSPVLIRPDITPVGGTQPANEPHVIGVVSAFIPCSDVVSNEDGQNWELRQNSGLAISVSSECILETIKEDFKKREQLFRGSNAETR